MNIHRSLITVLQLLAIVISPVFLYLAPNSKTNLTQEEMIFFRGLAQQGDAEAQFILGGCYDWGEGVNKDLQQAVTWYGKAAEQGHAIAQQYLNSIK